MSGALPLVDIGGLWTGDVRGVGDALDEALRVDGFVVLTGHGVPEALFDRLEAQAHRFFALTDPAKEAIAMRHAGRAWRGWFALGDELTSGLPDRKEGIYFGAEHDDTHPQVRAGMALFGRNQFPDEIPEMAETVHRWMALMTDLGQRLLAALAVGLGLDERWFADNLTADPTTLFRIFHYPPRGPGTWGVAEHTDYGLLTLLAEDDCGGLQVHSQGRWIDVVPTPYSLICNVGDMLERLTNGRYRSTPHRVRNQSGRNRLSLPFFLDPSWSATVVSMPTTVSDAVADGATRRRWDDADIFAGNPTYGEYLVAKVTKVFPELGQMTHRQEG